jgi:steroid delta-isomerase-like uncharacterized protein
MTTERTRETMQAYADALLSFGDYARYLADDVTMTFMGTDRSIKGRDAVRQLITHVHEQAFSSAIEVKSLVCGGDQAMIEAEFIGTHIGDFEGVPANLRPVRVPYTAAYTLADGRITSLRMYFPFELLMRQITRQEAVA